MPLQRVHQAERSGWVLPVGRPVGLVPAGGGGTRKSFVIALADSFVEVSLESQDVWWRARFLPDSSLLTAWAETEGIAGGHEVVERLFEAGLLTGVLQEAHDEWANEYRWIAQGIGTGLEDGLDDVFAIRDHAMDPVAAVNETVFAAWALSDGRRSLAAVAAHLSRQGRGSVGEVQKLLLASSPPLMEAGAVLLDRAA